MGKRLLNKDPFTGILTYHEYDSLTDETTISYEADSSATSFVLDTNQKIANDEDTTKKGIKQGWWLVASIPPILQIEWLINEGIDVYNKDHWPRVKAKLEDRDFSKVKTTHGHI